MRALKARKSLLRVAEYSFEQAVFGHGKPLDKRSGNEFAEGKIFGCKTEVAPDKCKLTFKVS